MGLERRRGGVKISIRVGLFLCLRKLQLQFKTITALTVVQDWGIQGLIFFFHFHLTYLYLFTVAYFRYKCKNAIYLVLFKINRKVL